MWRGGSVPLGDRLSIRPNCPPVSSESARTVNMQPKYQTEDSRSARRAYCAAPSGLIVMCVLLFSEVPISTPIVDLTGSPCIPPPRDLCSSRKEKVAGHARSLAAAPPLFTLLRGRGILGSSHPALCIDPPSEARGWLLRTATRRSRS